MFLAERPSRTAPSRSDNHNRLRASPATGWIMSDIRCSPGRGGGRPRSNPGRVHQNLRRPGTLAKSWSTKPAKLFRISRPGPLKPRLTAKSTPRGPVYQQNPGSSPQQLASAPNQSRTEPGHTPKPGTVHATPRMNHLAGPEAPRSWTTCGPPVDHQTAAD